MGLRATDLVKGMSTFRDNVRLFAWETEAEAEGLETDGAFALCILELVGDYWEGRMHGCKGVGGGGKIVCRGDARVGGIYGGGFG